MRKVLWLISAALLLSSFAFPQTNIRKESSPVTIQATMFGNHTHDRLQTEGLVPSVLNVLPGVKTMHTWDSGLVWSKIETARGVYDWSKLDIYVNDAYTRNVDVVFNLANTPTWASARPTENSPYCTACGWSAEPADNAYWDEFVTALATRYLGKIKYYEVWNEPNFAVGNTSFFSGTATVLATLHQHAYNIIKGIDPTALIISAAPSNIGAGIATTSTATAWVALRSYWSQVAAYTDIVGEHCYGYATNPEQYFTDIVNFKQAMTNAGLGGKPIWSTEGTFCGGLPCPDSLTEQGWTARMYLFQGLSGVDRYQWYAMNNGNFGVQATNWNSAGPYVLNANGIAYNETVKWLSGATVNYCESRPNGGWACHLTRPGGYVAWMTWNTIGANTTVVPATWSMVQYRDLTGGKFSVKVGDVVSIGLSPILFENKDAF